MKKLTRKERHEDYAGFVEKFNPKKTTDDCYTPPSVYEAVKQWVNDNIMPLEGIEIVRPFYPGGDYENYDYPDGCLVLDNPPFSILAKIRRFYYERGIKYFLFAPALTMSSGCRELDNECLFLGETHVRYENGAQVATGFVSNLDCGGTRIWISASLSEALRVAQGKKRLGKPTRWLPSVFPPQVFSMAYAGRIAVAGESLKFGRDEVYSVQAVGRGATRRRVFGGGWLLSEGATARWMEVEARCGRGIQRVELSEEEREIIRGLR